MTEDKTDHNGDGDFVDTDEIDDDRTYNKANELTARTSPGSYSPVHDAVGNMTEDGKSYKYVYDVFDRLVEVTDDTTPFATIAEYRYNGLGHRIAERRNTNGDGGVDASDHWYHFVYDASWRVIATYRLNGSLVRDSNPKEEFVNHQAGAGGSVTSLDRVILRDKDANTAWTTASDGTLEDRIYYCQNWRGDVSAVLNDSGDMLEWIKYSAYGVPFALPWGDSDSNGNRNGTDNNQVNNWFNASTYDVRGDFNLDGLLNMTDVTKMFTSSSVTMGRGTLSDVASRKGYAGYEFDEDIDLKYHVGSCVYSSALGVHLQRRLGRLATDENDGWGPKPDGWDEEAHGPWPPLPPITGPEPPHIDPGDGKEDDGDPDANKPDEEEQTESDKQDEDDGDDGDTAVDRMLDQAARDASGWIDFIDRIARNWTRGARHGFGWGPSTGGLPLGPGPSELPGGDMPWGPHHPIDLLPYILPPSR